MPLALHLASNLPRQTVCAEWGVCCPQDIHRRIQQPGPLAPSPSEHEVAPSHAKREEPLPPRPVVYVPATLRRIARRTCRYKVIRGVRPTRQPRDQVVYGIRRLATVDALTVQFLPLVTHADRLDGRLARTQTRSQTQRNSHAALLVKPAVTLQALVNQPNIAVDQVLAHGSLRPCATEGGRAHSLLRTLLGAGFYGAERNLSFSPCLCAGSSDAGFLSRRVATRPAGLRVQAFRAADRPSRTRSRRRVDGRRYPACPSQDGRCGR